VKKVSENNKIFDVYYLICISLLVLGGSLFAYGWFINNDTYIFFGGIIGAFGLAVTLAGLYLVFRGLEAKVSKLLKATMVASQSDPEDALEYRKGK